MVLPGGSDLSLFVKVAYFDILGAGNETGLTVASKNDVLEVRKEAIQNSIEPGCRPRFSWNNTYSPVAKGFMAP